MASIGRKLAGLLKKVWRGWARGSRATPHPGGLLNFYMRQNVAASKCRIDTISGMAICRIDTISSGARLCHIDNGSRAVGSRVGARG